MPLTKRKIKLPGATIVRHIHLKTAKSVAKKIKVHTEKKPRR